MLYHENVGAVPQGIAPLNCGVLGGALSGLYGAL